jgi:hypothetical protein
LATSRARSLAAEVVQKRVGVKSFGHSAISFEKGRERYFTGSNEGCYPSDNRAAWSLQ